MAPGEKSLSGEDGRLFGLVVLEFAGPYAASLRRFEKLLNAQALPFPVENKPDLLPHFCKYFMKTRLPPIENGSAPCHPNLHWLVYRVNAGALTSGLRD
ncbi:hypothetical protein HPB52_010773 [Rhipicephalus sanguineus]|uniref:Uncharacterized protein n=1 Tax=Rhipicephalus sanguineus TaxID=34632 RepID=A0A9D4QAJ9_RHISA|nr:hypothetical protein HPB52_010773 [Rhipicephalus sanguineus]